MNIHNYGLSSSFLDSDGNNEFLVADLCIMLCSQTNIDGFVQYMYFGNSIANALELPQSCIKPWIHKHLHDPLSLTHFTP